jgi:hypothetical protein
MSKKLIGKARANARKKAQKKWNFPKNPHKAAANGSGLMKGTPFQHKPTPGGGIMLNVSTEMGKLLSVVTDEVAPYDTRSNASDFNSMPWGDDGGFMIAIVPATTRNDGRGYFSRINDRAKLTSVLSDFKATKLDDNWDMLSNFCTSDRAWKHFNDIADTLHYATIGYSTIRNIAPLSENRNLCLALKNGTDPVKAMAKTATMSGVVA